MRSLVCALVVFLGSACTAVNDEMETSPETEKVPTIHLPVEGTWRLIRSPGHDTFAFDLVATDSASKRTLKKSRLHHLTGRAGADDSYSWSQPVYAPTDGTVAETGTGSPDRSELSLIRDLWAMIFHQTERNTDDIRPFAGNYVIIRGDGFYVFMAHLQHESLTVAAGDDVEVGELVGRVGNSGFTLEPHLHLQLFDRIDDLAKARAPAFVVAEFEQWTDRDWTPRADAPLKKGTCIRSAG